MYSVKLKKGKDKAVKQLHPWVFSGAVEQINGKPENGEVVLVTDFNGGFLAYGFYNNQSRVAIRLLEWNLETEINEDWWRKRIKKAVQSRQDLIKKEDTNT